MSNVRVLGQLLLLRANPQDVAYSPAWLALGIALHAGADLVATVGVVAMAPAFAIAALDTVLIVALVHTLLMWRSRGSRAVQTLTAITVSGGVLGFAAWIVAGLLPEGVPAWWVWSPFLIWFIGVFAHVLRHALDVPFPVALLLGFIYLVLSSGVTGMFLEPPPVR